MRVKGLECMVKTVRSLREWSTEVEEVAVDVDSDDEGDEPRDSTVSTGT